MVNLDGLIVHYDLTQIYGDFENNASNGSNLGEIGSTYGFSDTSPYKLRGAFSSGSTESAQTIHITGLNLNHTFSLSVWLSLLDNSVTRTIFSKDKGIGENAGDENLLDVESRTGMKVAVAMYTGTTDHFTTDINTNGCETSENTIDTISWFNLYLTLSFDGINTTAEIFVDTISSATCTASERFLEDRNTYPHAWLFIST